MEHVLKTQTEDFDILTSITYYDIRDTIDELGYSSQGARDKNSVSMVLKGKEWKVDVIIRFVIVENWLKMYSFADFINSDDHLGDGNLPMSGTDLYLKLNEYNRTTRFACAYLEDNVVFLERNNYADTYNPENEEKVYIPISRNYLRQNMESFIDVSAHFFSKYLFEIPQDNQNEN